MLGLHHRTVAREPEVSIVPKVPASGVSVRDYEDRRKIA
jgi:hypothetical protein